MSGTGSWDRYLLPYGNDSTMSAADMSSAWDGFFGSNAFATTQTTNNSLDGIFGIVGGSGGQTSVFTANPLWAGGSSGQFFGQ